MDFLEWVDEADWWVGTWSCDSPCVELETGVEVGTGEATDTDLMETTGAW